MICQVCKANQASIHLKEIKENLVSEVHVCQSCFQQRSADEAGVDSMSHSLHLAASLEQTSAFQTAHTDTVDTDLACPACGLAFGDFLEVGRLGCSACYQAFSEQLGPFLNKIHGAVSHTGKRPQQETKSLDLRHTLSRLQTDLDKAIADEQYELAADLRDQIRDFEQQMISGASDV